MIGLACSTLSCDGFLDNQFKTTFEVAPQVGFKFVELNCWHASDLTPQGIRQAKKRCRDVGLTPIAIYGSSFGTASSFEVGKDVGHKVRMIEAAWELGCRLIVATGTQRGEGGGLAHIIAVLEQIVPLAEESDVLISLENHAQNNLETIEDYEQIFKAIPSPHVGLCVDTGHFEAANVNLNQVITHLFNKINHIHVKETSQLGVTNFVRFGQGVTDNNKFIETVLTQGYSGYISVELALEDKSTLIEDISQPYAMFSKYESV